MYKVKWLQLVQDFDLYLNEVCVLVYSIDANFAADI